MSSKMPQPSSAVHPPVGTLIDGDSLELVEVLGVGGYGVVYRAVDARYPTGPKSYAVKCLVTSGHQSARQRQVHIREIALHQLASAHPGVVTLHRVVEQYNHTYIIMEYASDHDLFTQILHNCRYLGNDALIKDIFLQMLDAVEYCHSLGIYHRDLKPENILCFDDGLRVAITDFGLATTDKISDEFRTGSVYHMSPECQGGAFAPGGKYSPMFNDIWSLGIILLNLATGRNPWKSATPDDPTFQAYLRDPYTFLPTVLPISAELNEILVQMLDVDWRRRMKLHEIRYAIEELTTFYSDGVIFEGSMARCPWEAGMDIDSESSANTQEVSSSPPVSPVQEQRLTSQWSKDSTSDIVFAPRSPTDDSTYGVPWPAEYSSCGATWAYESPVSSFSSEDDDHFRMDTFDRPDTPSEASTQSPPPSLPATPNDLDVTFAAQQDAKPRARLTLDTNVHKPRIVQANTSMEPSFSTDSDMMHTAIEYDPYSSLFFLATPLSSKLMGPDSAVTAVAEDREMTSPSAWRTSVVMSSPSLYSSSASSSSDDIVFSRSGTPSPEPWPLSTTYSAQVQSTPSQQCQPISPLSGMMTDSPSRPSLSPFVAHKKLRVPPTSGLSKPSSPIRVFSPPSPTTPTVYNAASGSSNDSGSSQASQLHYRFSKLFPRTNAPTPAPAAPSSTVRPASRGRAFHAKPYPTFGRRKAGVAKAGKGDRDGKRAQQQRSVGSADGGEQGSLVASVESSSTTASACSGHDSAGTCGSASSSVSGGSCGVVVENVERKRVLGKRIATKHWFPGRFFNSGVHVGV
ncbi:STE/STE11 protein kinase [Coprinopsis cinerea AmutBmut pab1-1]|nr:STE/STE11 protein kinase [Coprinopsis cinerea AmutBmut pab1-1]